MRLAPHPFTLRQLQYIIAVAEHLSFRRAAERCHVSQPGLSSQISDVEQALSVALFERDKRRVLVTAAGEAFVARARAILREADDLVELSTRFGDPLSGTLRIGVIPTISPYLLPEIAPRLREALPRLSVIWVEDKTSSLVSKLEGGELDGALLAIEADLGQLEHIPLGDDPFVLAVAHDHPLARRKGPVGLKDLGGESVLLLDDGHCFRDQALAFCARVKAEERELRATSLATLAQMAASGQGVTLLPALAVPIENRRGDLHVRRFASPAPSRTIGLAFRRGTTLRPALEAVAATARARYAELMRPAERSARDLERRA